MSPTTSIVDRLIASVNGVGLPPAGPLCLAVSGGLDSVALVHLFCMSPWADRLHIIHVHHGLRGAAADADAAFVEQLARSRGLGFTVRHVDTLERSQRDKAGIEAAARTLRYEALAGVALQIGSGVVATAHTVNDQAETILMRILRGTGVDGLQGIRHRRSLGAGITCIRPLLDVSRTELLDAAATSGWTWREDLSNVDLYFRRNAIRHQLLPALVDFGGAAIIRHVARLAEAAADASTIVERYVESLDVDTSSTSLSTKALDAYSDDVRRAVLRSWLRAHIERDPSHGMVHRVMNAITLQPGSCVDVDANYVVVVDRHYVTLSMRDVPTSPRSSVVVMNGVGTYETENTLLIVSNVLARGDAAHTVYVDAATVKFPMTWRPWQDGDKMRVLNGPGTQLVSDILTNARVQPSERRSIRVVEDAHGIIWLCGYRIAHRVRCSEHTTSFLSFICPPRMDSPTTATRVRVYDRTFKSFITRDEIDVMVSSIADRLNVDYHDKEITLLVVLNGAMVFASDLARRVYVPCRFETIRASSYGSGVTSSGTVVLDRPLPSLEGRHVVIVEDIVDSGLTMEHLVHDVNASGAASVAIAALLSKPDVHKHRVDVAYVGREIGSEFVVGYGLDYAGYGRELDAIWVVDDEGASTSAEIRHT